MYLGYDLAQVVNTKQGIVGKTGDLRNALEEAIARRPTEIRNARNFSD